MNLRNTDLYRKLTPYLATAYAEGFCEGENATSIERATGFQYLIDNGQINQLQGWFGRTAKDLIEADICQPAEQ